MKRYDANLPLLCEQLYQFRHDNYGNIEVMDLVDRVIDEVLKAYGGNITESELCKLSINQRKAGRISRFSEDMKAEIRRKHENGETLTNLAAEYQCSKSQIHRIAGHSRW